MTEQEKKEIALRNKEAIDPSQGEPTRAGSYFTPVVDIYETDEAITVVADMPGVDKDHLDVDLRENVLTITGHVGDQDRRFKPIYEEYGVGGYSRRFTLGDRIDQNKIDASLKDGVLTLKLQKAERLRPRKIQIAAG